MRIRPTLAPAVLALTLLAGSPTLPAWAQPAPAAAAPDSAALVSEIERIFAEMELAVINGDQEQYLSLIDRRDPVFEQEHINWAKDLERGLPAAFDMVLASEPTVVGGRSADGTVWEEVRAMVEMRYTPGATEGGQAHEPRVIRYRARFTSAIPGVLPVISSNDVPPTPGSWLTPLVYGGEAWEILEHGTTRVMFAPKFREVARIVVEALPPIREHIDAQMQSDNSEHIQVVKIYGDMQHLQASIYLSYVDGLSGWNEPGESIKIMAREPRGPRTLDNLLAHEYGHAATFWMGDAANKMPWWTLEGIADYVSGAYRADYDSTLDPARPRPIPENLAGILKTWGETDRLPPWQDLADFHTVDPRWTGNVYTQGNHMLAYITEHFGVAARNQWLREMAQGASLDEATRTALGRSFEDLDVEWRASVMPKDEVDAVPGT